MKCGLLGRKLGHSYSPQIHRHFGDYSYSLFEREPDELETFLKQGDFTGINVTIPYKKAVIPYLDAISPAAGKVGAVNTIVRKADGTLYGHNTDLYGFSSMVCRSRLDVAGKKVLVLGSGGASNTAVSVLNDLGAMVTVISRSGENNYENLHLHPDARLIVNCTPVGMYPNNSDSPIDLCQFPNLEGVLDLIYNPARTQLLQQAESRGLVAENGLWMLVAQAKEAAELFTGCRISDDTIAQIHKKLSSRMQNIILIGMPGSGKTTIGKLLAEKTGRTFVDTDEAIVRAAGRSIPDIFHTDGETGFRQCETQVLKELCGQSALVIATGGGCVTQPCNYPLLHQNGRIIWIRRETAALPTEGRPLSQGADLAAMYQLRKPMYERFSDFAFANNSTPEITADAILSRLEETI